MRAERNRQTEAGSQGGSEAQTGSAAGKGMHRAPPSPTRIPQPCTKQHSSTEVALTEE